MPISSVCSDCGTIKKSGKISCCGLGGSWFGNCGSAGNANLGHTWHEGIRVCETQFQAVVGERLHAYQANNNASFDNTSMGTNFNAVIAATHMLASTPANTSAPAPGATPITVSDNTQIIAAERKPVAYYVRMIASKTSNAATTIIMHTLINISKPKTIIPPADRTISQVNGTTIESMHSASASIPTSTSSRASSSGHTTARECENLLRFVAYVSVMLAIFYWC